MNKKTIFKGLALTNFIILLILFLLFRYGYFDKNFSDQHGSALTSPNGGTVNKIVNDTTPKRKDSLHKQFFPSSKSVVIIDNLKPKLDSPRLIIDSIRPLTEREKQLMYSSKSGMIIDRRVFVTDSSKIKRDKLKGKQQQ
ncbi:MAG: hypothetical protein QM737_16260 [Ferruginibacter sp.]